MILLLNMSSSYVLLLTWASFTMACSEHVKNEFTPLNHVTIKLNCNNRSDRLLQQLSQVCFHRYIVSASLSPTLSRDTALFTVIHQAKKRSFNVCCAVAHTSTTPWSKYSPWNGMDKSCLNVCFLLNGSYLFICIGHFKTLQNKCFFWNVL